MKIQSIKARQILDSRGNPTVEVDLVAGGHMARASVPSGASTGSFEAVELRDGDKSNYLGKSVEKAVGHVNKEIAKALKGHEVTDQKGIDELMIKLDGTPNKGKFGANAILGVSLAALKASAMEKGVSLHKYIGKGTTLPVPMMNVLNGGKHADNSVNVQEFMIMPIGAKSFAEGLRWCATVYHTLKGVLKADGLACGVGDEGGFAPNLKDDEDALKYLCKAVEKAGYTLGKDFAFAIDAAATEMYDEAKKIGHEGNYYFWKTGKEYTAKQMVEYWEKMCAKYPIVSLEDALSEEDWNAWKMLTDAIGNKVQLVGDDLFVTNPERLKKGIKLGVANAILIKVNQIGSYTETIEAIKIAHKAGYKTVISHRSGETEDTTIADIAVGLDLGQIKTGAPCRTDRVAKYNQLLRIEEELGKKAKFGGKCVLR